MLKDDNNGENIELGEATLAVQDGLEDDSNLVGNILTEYSAETNYSKEHVSEENQESTETEEKEVTGEHEETEQKEESTEDRISFARIWSEFNLKTLYTDRDKQEMAKIAAQNLTVGAVPTCMDVYTDIQLFIDYLYGTVYEKSVDTLNHHYVNSSECTLNFKTSVESWTGTDWEEENVFYGYSCFEGDPIFAWCTLAFIFLPGLSFLSSIFMKVETWQGKLVSPLIVVSWPFLLVLSKLVAIFHPGKEFKKWCNYLSVKEGNHEAAPQLCLQVYILFSRGDRSPSVLQWAALVTSFIAFNFPQIQAFNSTKPPVDGPKEEIRRIVQLLPLFVTTAIFRILSMVIVCVLLRYYAVFFYGAVLMFFGIFFLFPATRYLMDGGGFLGFFTVRNIKPSAFFNIMKKIDLTSAEKEKYNIRYKQFHMMFWLILNTVTLIIFLIICNSSDVNFEVFGSEHSWRSLPIVSNIILINSITAFTLCCGVFSLILFYLQVEQ